MEVIKTLLFIVLLVTNLLFTNKVIWILIDDANWCYDTCRYAEMIIAIILAVTGVIWVLTGLALILLNVMSLGGGL